VLRTIPITAFLMFGPVLAFAATQPCNIRSPAYPFDYSREASQLLDSMRQEAQQVVHNDTILRTNATDPSFPSPNDANRLNFIRGEADAMGQQLCRLRSLKSVAEPWEQRAIARVASQVRYLADNTGDAFTYIHNHERGLRTAQFRQYTHNIDSGANAVSRTIRRAENREQIRTDETETGADAGLWRK
jgi:hypothetical protein